MSAPTTTMSVPTSVYGTGVFWERLWRMSGINFVAFFIIAYVIYGHQPQIGASADTLVTFYDGERTAATAATATAVALPLYGATVLGVNLHNKKSIKEEFNRRRLRLPLVLAAGETRTGSLFFPMVPNPQSLIVSWSSQSGGGDSRGGDTVLSLDFLQGLHVKGAHAKDTTSPPRIIQPASDEGHNDIAVIQALED